MVLALLLSLTAMGQKAGDNLIALQFETPGGKLDEMRAILIRDGWEIDQYDAELGVLSTRWGFIKDYQMRMTFTAVDNYIYVRGRIRNQAAGVMGAGDYEQKVTVRGKNNGSTIAYLKMIELSDKLKPFSMLHFQE